MNDKIIKDFINYISLKNYSSNTITSYKKDLEEISIFFNNKKCLESLNTENIKKYIEFLYNNNNKATSMSRKISTLKSFYKFISKNNDDFISPMKRIYYPKKEKRLPKFIYYNEFIEIINSAKKEKYGIRDALLIEFMFDTGVRVSELVNVQINNIDDLKKEVRVLGKGNKERIVYYGEYVRDLINEYLPFRNSFSKAVTHDYLFVNKNGDRITDRGVRLIVSKIMKKLSIKTKISPHTLRHSFATSMLNEGADIKVVQELLGHENLGTTEIYTHVTNDRLKEIYLNSFPRSKERRSNNE